MSIYLYETHLHTAEGSACSKVPGADYPAVYKKLGYTGIFVTDHFFNGNCAVDRSLPWEEMVDGYCLGYERAKEAGDKIGFDVFFGIEFNFRGDEFLLYGPDKKWLKEHPDIMKWTHEELRREVHKIGGIMIQAHPFRDRNYLDAIRVHPYQADAFEVYNAGNLNYMNGYAYDFALRNNIKMTSGTDIHHLRDAENKIGAVCFTGKITSSVDYARRIMKADKSIMINRDDKTVSEALGRITDSNYGFLVYDGNMSADDSAAFTREILMFDNKNIKHVITPGDARKYRI